MMTILAGATATLTSTWYAYPGGPAVDLTGVTITITPIAGGAPTVGPTSAGVTHPGTGVYAYAWDVPAGQAGGDYLAQWSGTDPQGDPVTASEVVTILAASAGPVLTDGAWYCTREQVARAADIKETARAAAAVDRACAGARDSVEGLLHRSFLPILTTRYFDWPDESSGRSWRLWLGQHSLIAAYAVTSGGVELDAGDYLLRPDHGPPFNRVEINLAGSAAWESGDSHQRAIGITGLFGHTADTARAGVLAEALDDSETAVDVTNGAAAGVGDVLLCGAERMIVTGRSMLDTGQGLAADLAANNGATAVTVADGSAYAVDEVLLVDGERLLVVDIAGDTLIVRRAWDGTVLAAHTAGADVYASRTLTVTRGALGTTAAAHSSAAPLSRHLVPPLVRQLAIAEAIVILQQESAAYARTAGSGDSEREVSGKGLRDLRDQAYTRYGRKARKAAV